MDTLYLFQVARLLLDHRANVNVRDIYGTSILGAAAGGRMHLRFGTASGLIKLLLERGAHVDTFDRFGYTPIQGAIASDDLAAVKVLLEEGGAGAYNR